ncbi:SDR family NAD(P)-dependent oxidoreductase [Streptomyces sp. CG1]|uniref:SDR family NAD(P)-dependent oxidoreductase n=1 Tax=Streptomyces sp. CG1 TaxID=1287523 RepID=UPI0034E2A2D4
MRVPGSPSDPRSLPALPVTRPAGLPRPRDGRATPAPAAVTVVTGAGRGLGRAIAHRLAQGGHHLVLGDVDGPAVREAAAALAPHHLALEADVTRPDSMDALAEAAVSRFGRLDVWVNNAGVVPLGPFDELTDDELAYACTVNLTGVAHGCRAALARMRPRHHGHIVNIASLVAVKPLPGLAAYSATKAGVLALSEGLRRELRGRDIHVTTVLPYMVNTPAAAGLRPRLLPALRPEQVADAVSRVIRHPRPRVFVPRAGRLLSWMALAPQWAQDLADRLLKVDDIALRADTAARRPYDAELHHRAGAR